MYSYPLVIEYQNAMINMHYSMNKLQILLIWLLSCQGISGHNWLKYCIISQMPDLLKILDCYATQGTNFTDAVKLGVFPNSVYLIEVHASLIELNTS